MWQRSESTDGLAKKKSARGSIMGWLPEALCGEAPKGQPRIHSCRSRKTNKSRPGGRKHKHEAGEGPTIITVDQSGEVRNWGPLKGQCVESLLLPPELGWKSPSLPRKKTTREGQSKLKNDQRGKGVVLVSRKEQAAPAGAPRRKRRPPDSRGGGPHARGHPGGEAVRTTGRAD